MVFSPLGEVIKSVGNIEVLRTRNLKQFNAYFVLFGKTETLSSYITNGLESSNKRHNLCEGRERLSSKAEGGCRQRPAKAGAEWEKICANCRSFSKPSAAAVAVVAFNEINDFIRTWKQRNWLLCWRQDEDLLKRSLLYLVYTKAIFT